MCQQAQNSSSGANRILGEGKMNWNRVTYQEESFDGARYICWYHKMTATPLIYTTCFPRQWMGSLPSKEGRLEHCQTYALLQVGLQTSCIVEYVCPWRNLALLYVLHVGRCMSFQFISLFIFTCCVPVSTCIHQ